MQEMYLLDEYYIYDVCTQFLSYGKTNIKIKQQEAHRP